MVKLCGGIVCFHFDLLLWFAFSLCVRGGIDRFWCIDELWCFFDGVYFNGWFVWVPGCISLHFGVQFSVLCNFFVSVVA